MPRGQMFSAPIHVEVDAPADALVFLLACGHSTTRERALWPHWQPSAVRFPVKRLRCEVCERARADAHA